MAPFEITVDRTCALVRITLRGFWDLDTIAAYEPAFRLAFTQLATLRAVATGCLVDARDYPVQAGAVTKRHAEIVAALGPLQADRGALIVTSKLTGMQASRGLPDERIRVFDSEADGLAWLGCANA